MRIGDTVQMDYPFLYNGYIIGKTRKFWIVKLFGFPDGFELKFKKSDLTEAHNERYNKCKIKRI